MCQTYFLVIAKTPAAPDIYAARRIAEGELPSPRPIIKETNFGQVLDKSPARMQVSGYPSSSFHDRKHFNLTYRIGGALRWHHKKCFSLPGRPGSLRPPYPVELPQRKAYPSRA